MATISINDFQIITGTGAEDYILLSYNGGQGGKIAIGTFKAQMTPSIKDGKWWIGGVDTNVTAQGTNGKTPIFRRGESGIEYSYEGENSWNLLVPYSELKLNFDDLTEEQKSQLKMTLDDLSAEDIALLQKPANDMIDVLESTNSEMQKAKDDAQDTADHPTYVGVDYYVYQWNKDTKKYDKTDIYVKGEQGEQGIQGAQGAQGEQGEQGIQGEQGEQGLTPVFEFGTIETLEPNQQAEASIVRSGNTADGNPLYMVSLAIPKGENGQNGTGSGNVLVDASGLVTGKQYAFTPKQNGSAEGRFVEVVQTDTSKLATKEELENGLKEKQDTISDLDEIRENAGKGKDALESLKDKSNKIEVVLHGTGDTTFTLTPNTFHRWGEVSYLSLTLATPSDSTIYNEYMFEFVSGSTATTLLLPDTLKWVAEPSIEAGHTYQCSIVNNIGVIAGVSNS